MERRIFYYHPLIKHISDVPGVVHQGSFKHVISGMVERDLAAKIEMHPENYGYHHHLLRGDDDGLEFFRWLLKQVGGEIGCCEDLVERHIILGKPHVEFCSEMFDLLKFKNAPEYANKFMTLFSRYELKSYNKAQVYHARAMRNIERLICQIKHSYKTQPF